MAGGTSAAPPAGADPDPGPAPWRGKELVAGVLAATGGFVDAAGYLALFHLFTAHQSGNSAGLGVALGSAAWTDVWRRGTSIVSFVVGVGIGTLLVEWGKRRGWRSTGAPVAVAQLLAMAGAVGVGESVATAGRIAPASTAAYAVAAACLAGSMGLQTVSLRRIGGRTVRTTFVTGVLTNVAESFVVSFFRPDRRGRRRLLSLSGLLGSVWLLYLAGAVAGGVAESRWSFAALGFPMAAVAAVAAWQARSGYSADLPWRGLGE